MPNHANGDRALVARLNRGIETLCEQIHAAEAFLEMVASLLEAQLCRAGEGTPEELVATGVKTLCRERRNAMRQAVYTVVEDTEDIPAQLRPAKGGASNRVADYFSQD